MLGCGAGRVQRFDKEDREGKAMLILLLHTPRRPTGPLQFSPFRNTPVDYRVI